MNWFPLSLRTRQHSDDIAQLDPQQDADAIFERLFLREFPLDFFISTELGQLRTFSFPAMSRLLHRTGHYENEGVKRLDDTKAILQEMARDGFNSPHGRVAAAHLNQIHSFYDIPNEAYLYTLSVFIFDPWLWIQQYGWRPLTEKEKDALYHYYRQMGQALHIQDIPDSFAAFWQWRLAYEQENQQFAPSNHQVAMGLINAAKAFVPAPVRPWLPPVIATLLGAPLRQYLGLKHPPVIFQWLVRGLFRLRAIWLRFFTIWDKQDFRESSFITRFLTYPHGYQLHLVGPTKLIRQIHAEQAAER